MFLGHYQTNFDTEKGRTALPSNFRRQVGKSVILTKGYEGSLFLVSVKDWEQIVGTVTGQGFLSAYSRQTDRFLLGNAFEIGLDAQGRFVIPLKLREYAKLGKEIVFVGVGKRIEVWDRIQWEKNDQYLNDHIVEMSEKLEEKGN